MNLKPHMDSTYLGHEQESWLILLYTLHIENQHLTSHFMVHFLAHNKIITTFHFENLLPFSPHLKRGKEKKRGKRT